MICNRNLVELIIGYATISVDMESKYKYSNLLAPGYKEDIKRWIDDDCPSFDIGGFVVGDKAETAVLYCKSSGVFAGLPFADAVFEYLGLAVDWHVDEGRLIDLEEEKTNKYPVAHVSGPCRNILLAERTALNIITRASGIATQARQAKHIAEKYSWSGHIAGTRKTTPGFKHVEKYALLVGGIATHRQDLSQMVMLKDNHIWSCGSITAAVHKAKLAAGFSSKIEVECQSVDEAWEACQAGADIVMLDNFTAATIGEAAKQVKEKYPHVLIEASGVSLRHPQPQPIAR
jgi:nicotinate-nucleotide pyrophosphorylase (carboxylating)